MPKLCALLAAVYCGMPAAEARTSAAETARARRRVAARLKPLRPWPCP